MVVSDEQFADLLSKLEAFETKIEAVKASSKQELDIQANKIHSSYAKKIKELSKSSEDDDEVVVPGVESKPRRPTKNELELQKSVETLVQRLEATEKKSRLATQRSATTEVLLKNGINPEAAGMVFDVLSAKGSFVDDADGNFKMKVNIDGADVNLPIESAVKHYVKSPEAKFFLAPKGAAGSGAKQPAAGVKDATDGKAKSGDLEVDWKGVVTRGSL